MAALIRFDVAGWVWREEPPVIFSMMTGKPALLSRKPAAPLRPEHSLTVMLSRGSEGKRAECTVCRTVSAVAPTSFTSESAINTMRRGVEGSGALVHRLGFAVCCAAIGAADTALQSSSCSVWAGKDGTCANCAVPCTPEIDPQ